MTAKTHQGVDLEFVTDPVTPLHPQNMSFVSEVILSGVTEEAYRYTRFPFAVDREDVKAWLHYSGWQVWVVKCQWTAVAVLGVHDTNGIMDDPEYSDALLMDAYVLPQWRGRNIAVNAWSDIERDYLPPGVRVLSEAWEGNKSAVRQFEKGGWQKVGSKYHYGRYTGMRFIYERIVTR